MWGVVALVLSRRPLLVLLTWPRPAREGHATPGPSALEGPSGSTVCVSGPRFCQGPGFTVSVILGPAVFAHDSGFSRGPLLAVCTFDPWFGAALLMPLEAELVSVLLLMSPGHHLPLRTRTASHLSRGTDFPQPCRSPVPGD